MNTRPESDSDSDDCHPSAALIAAAENNKGAEVFYDKERNLYYCIDETNAAQTPTTHAPVVDIPENKPAQSLTSDIHANLRVKRPTSEKGEIAPPLLYDAEADQFHFNIDRQRQNKKSSNNNHQHGFYKPNNRTSSQLEQKEPKNKFGY